MPEPGAQFQSLPVDLPQASYPVYLGTGLLRDAGPWAQHLGRGQVLIVTNDTVAPLLLEPLERALAAHRPAVHLVPDGEQFKTLETWAAILDRLVSMQARRDAVIVALGGGVVGDLAGFAAASYMRGVRIVQIPTTLLAQVDASVGGKTGVNHPQGKNLIGAFHQPAAVVIDTETLDTLPEREYRAGLAEVVKYGAIMDAPLLDWLEAQVEAIQRREPAALRHLIHRSIENKARVVVADERESGHRAILNFGHSFGHALESLTGYRQFLHGEAVAIGMVVAACLSEQRGLCGPGRATRLENLLRRFGLPTRWPGGLGSDELIRSLGLDKKAERSGLRLVLLNELGRAMIDRDSSTSAIEAALRACRPAEPATA